MSDKRSDMRDRGGGRVRRRYPVAHTSPWFFLVLAGATLFFILAGVFEFGPVMQVFHWLAVVL